MTDAIAAAIETYWLSGIHEDTLAEWWGTQDAHETAVAMADAIRAVTEHEILHVRAALELAVRDARPAWADPDDAVAHYLARADEWLEDDA